MLEKMLKSNIKNKYINVCTDCTFITQNIDKKANKQDLVILVIIYTFVLVANVNEKLNSNLY